MRHVESSALELVQGRATLTRALTPAEKDCFDTRVAAIQKSLMPANGEADMKRIARALSAALMGYPRSDTDKLVRDYTRLLAVLPPWAVEQACDDIRRGAASSINPTYPPSAPEIHKLAEGKLNEAKRERNRLTLLLGATVKGSTAQPSDDARKRIELKRMEFHEQMDAAGRDRAQEEMDKAARLEAEKRKAAREEHTRRMEYVLQGYEPPTNEDGMTITMSLAMATGMKLTKRAPAPAPKCEFSPEE